MVAYEFNTKTLEAVFHVKTGNEQNSEEFVDTLTRDSVLVMTTVQAWKPIGRYVESVTEIIQS